jgi:oxygen-dependent protoporphyrinogen oxidase
MEASLELPEHDETVEVVVLGAGLAGMSAAYELRDRKLVVLDALDRIGGRTYSGGDDQAWYNIGAQLISSDRLVSLAGELGIDLVSLKSADFGFAVNKKFARGSSSERLFLNLNLPWRRKIDFGRAALRLQRKLKTVPRMNAQQRAKMDEVSLQEVIGRVAPTTARMLSECCENAVGIPASGASGLFGLSYGLGAFLDPNVKQHLYSVRGGTQRITLGLAERLPAEAVRLGCKIESVRQIDERVAVTYGDSQGARRVLLAEQCVCALPAWAVLQVVDGLPDDKAAAVRRITPYSSLISIAWPVADGKPTPWDGVFTAPIVGDEGFNLLTNYGFLTKQTHPELGGYLNTLSAGAKADLFEAVDDKAMLDRMYGELVDIFPEARSLVDRDGAVVQRWHRRGLPPVRPGYLNVRPLLRQGLGNVHFCGDYTSEPGLPGASNSGTFAARAAAERLTAVAAAGL